MTSMLPVLIAATLTSSPVTLQDSGAEKAAEDRRFTGIPRIGSSDGWSIKPRGRIQYDLGSVSAPDGIAGSSRGLDDELRRARLGVEGTIPGGLGYVAEFDFAGGEVEISDFNLSWTPVDPVKLTIGQHNPFQSLEELTSSRFTSFMERAAFTDAFNLDRRLGLSVSYEEGDLIAQAGLFTDNLNVIGGEDDSDLVSLDGRIVFAPELGGSRLHLGASAHHRRNGDRIATGGVDTRYRQRPLVHFTDTRFLSTPSLAVESETGFGVEAALIRGPFHAVAELHRLDADLAAGAGSPTFHGGYAEIGYFLTGETRGYRGGKFDRTKVRRPVDGARGGAGALQLNLRFDYLDLNSGAIIGGKQNSLQVSLIWIPTDHVRFLLNYANIAYDDAVISGPTGDRDYRVDVWGARAQVDF